MFAFDSVVGVKLIVGSVLFRPQLVDPVSPRCFRSHRGMFQDKLSLFDKKLFPLTCSYLHACRTKYSDPQL